MGMRLLPKSELNKAKAEEKRREIDEGVKLAKRIDSLRETAAEESASLEKFRVQTVERIQAETDKYRETRDNLKKEVSELERTRKELLKPLAAEWDEIDTQKEKLEKEKHDVGQIQKQTKQNQLEAKKLFALAERAKNQAEFNEEEKEKALGDAKNAKKEALHALDQARMQVIRTDRECKNKLKLVEIREGRCKEREKSAKIKEQEIKEEKSKLAKEWRLLRDRQQLLERNIKRFNQ